MVRLGLVSPADSAIGESHRVVDATIRATTTTGAGWHRYNSDGYGDRASDGRPWAPSGQGTGHLWPVLAGERGEYDVANGDATSALSLLAAMRDGASGVGLIPEQVWELPDLAPSPFGTHPTGWNVQPHSARDRRHDRAQRRCDQLDRHDRARTPSSRLRLHARNSAPRCHRSKRRRQWPRKLRLSNLRQLSRRRV